MDADVRAMQIACAVGVVVLPIAPLLLGWEAALPWQIAVGLVWCASAALVHHNTKTGRF